MKMNDRNLPLNIYISSFFVCAKTPTLFVMLVYYVEIHLHRITEAVCFIINNLNLSAA